MFLLGMNSPCGREQNVCLQVDTSDLEHMLDLLVCSSAPLRILSAADLYEQ